MAIEFVLNFHSAQRMNDCKRVVSLSFVVPEEIVESCYLGQRHLGPRTTSLKKEKGGCVVESTDCKQ